MLTKEHRPLLTAFTTFDAGLHDLPVEMVRRRAAVNRIEALLVQLGEPPSVHAVEAKLVREWAERACAEDLKVDLKPVDRAEADLSQHRRQSRMLNLALSEAGAAMADAVHSYADEAIRDHLAPALSRIVTEAREAVAAYAEHGTSVAAMLGAPDDARVAYRKVDDLAAAFAQIRQTRYRMVQFTGEPQQDSRGDFAFIKNAEQMWPSLTAMGRSQFQYEPPWRGLDTRALLEWLAANPEAVVWCPTAAEQDQRWHEVFGARVAAMQANRHGSEALLAVMGGRG